MAERHEELDEAAFADLDEGLDVELPLDAILAASERQEEDDE